MVILTTIFLVSFGITKQNSCVIKELGSELSEWTIAGFRPETVAENQKSRISTEENARALLPLVRNLKEICHICRVC
jgi:hypothetical protein